MPAGVTAVRVDYSSQESLVAALKGQDILVITMSVMAPAESQNILIDAASLAGVPWVMPNFWSSDPDAKEMQRDNMIGMAHQATRRYIQEKGNLSFVGLTCNFWYEHSLAYGWAFGFDAAKREALFYDEGNVKIMTSTFPRCGEAVARILSLPILPQDEQDKQPTLNQFRNGDVYVTSFLMNQKDMFASLLRVTGTQEGDWRVQHRPARDVYAEGKKELGEGNRLGFGKLLYSRGFYATGEGDYTTKLNNEILGFQMDENLDEATERAIPRQKAMIEAYSS